MYATKIEAADGGGKAAATRRDDGELLGVTIALALIVGLIHRLAVGWPAPLWLDETFTATIATQRDFAGLLRWCLTELSGPFYYMPLWAWTKIAGDSDTAFRLPSLACSIAAPAIILWRGHPDRRTRLLWASLVAVWLPGLDFATEARPYAQIFLLTTVQAIVFLRMMRRPATRTALGWVVVSSLAILTHYHTLVITALQGFAYLGFGGRAAWRSSLAALAFLPAAAWMAFHLPFVLAFVGTKTVWYSLLPPSAVLALPAMVSGMAPAAADLFVMLIAAGSLWFGWRRAQGMRGETTAPEALLVASGMLAIGIVFAMAFVRPSFTPRYLLAYMPAVLFGLACWLRALERAVPRAAAALLGFVTALAIAYCAVRIANWRVDHRNFFNFEQPSAWLRTERVKRLVFLWDSPSASFVGPSAVHNIADMGGFFLRRDRGPAVPVEVLLPPQNADPNALLAAELRQPGTAILWSYDVTMPGTRGIRYPARMVRTVPGVRCRDFGGGSITVLACIHPPLPAR